MINIPEWSCDTGENKNHCIFSLTPVQKPFCVNRDKSFHSFKPIVWQEVNFYPRIPGPESFWQKLVQKTPEIKPDWARKLQKAEYTPIIIGKCRSPMSDLTLCQIYFSPNSFLSASVTLKLIIFFSTSVSFSSADFSQFGWSRKNAIIAIK